MEEHMNIHLKSETKEAIKAFSISGIIIVLFYLIISNLLLRTKESHYLYRKYFLYTHIKHLE